MQLLIENLTFSYSSDRMVLRDIELMASSRETIAVVGLSGCGKSTLLRLCCGILPQSKHQVIQGSIKINEQDPETYVKQGKVGFMFQEPALLANCTVNENIALPLSLKNDPDKDRLCEEVTGKVGLKDYSNYLPAQLSGGMKTRVALARTFINKPEFLLLDEPFGALDISWKFHLYGELFNLISEYNPMVMLVTHDIQEALLLSNHIILLGKNGMIREEIKIDKPLTRVLDVNGLAGLQEELFSLQAMLMSENPQDHSPAEQPAT